MLNSMIALFAPPIALAMSLYSGVDAAASTVGQPPVAHVSQAAAAEQSDISEITAPGIQLGKYMTPTGKAGLCAEWALMSRPYLGNPAGQQASKECASDLKPSAESQSQDAPKPDVL